MAAKKKQPTTATVAATENATETVQMVETTTTGNTSEAKSRFNAALDEAKAGASALGDEAKERAEKARIEAKARGEEWSVEAKTKASELAQEGKHKASEALTGLSRVINENAPAIDEKLGAKYGDFARNASTSLQDNARKLDEKSFEELAEDSRTAIRKSPAAAVGLAAVVGFFFARLFR
ncbi:hypothetical protein [Aurantiacibacter marinus]|nr:hypothetical protein [Aurantiacibacter marinus]